MIAGARLVVGMFETTLSTFLQENPGRIVFVRLDADLHSSTGTVLRLLGDRLGPDTVWLGSAQHDASEVSATSGSSVVVLASTALIRPETAQRLRPASTRQTTTHRAGRRAYRDG